MAMQISFIGLGVMGYPMAGHLAGLKEVQVRVWNRSSDKSRRWLEEYPGSLAESPAEAAAGADLIITCVGADPDLAALYLGPDGIMAHAPAGALLVDHTTASAQMARNLAEEAQRRQLQWLDAPVSGGQQGAQKGQLTIMCGGEKTAFERARPVLDVYARAINHLGAAGAGQLTKCVNQIAVAGVLQGLAEGLHFAEEAGLNREAVLQVISQGAAQSWQMDNRSATMLAEQYEHGFAVDWMRKDLAICLQEARSNGAALPATALIDQFYGDVQGIGGGRWDTSSLLERLRRNRKKP
ncbi:MAG: NAD(P)-dependent oxidoreductase [Halomonadaceae bacterium]|nr:MAG: NAD(P)-dependent oxidoreductase [Halomonadaceae bacterium]